MLYGTYRMLLALAVVSVLFTGCAKPQKIDPGIVFFPPPPDEPRIQYLTGIEDSTDIEGKKKNFSLVLTGNETGSVVKKIGKANEISVHQGKLYVSSTGYGQVVIIDLINKKFDFLKGNQGAGKLKKPVSTTVDADGNIYVADTGRNDIIVFDPEGNYRRSLKPGDESWRIVSVVAFGNDLYALDNRASLIRVLDRKTGEEKRSFGRDFDDPMHRLALPFAMTIDEQGAIYVTNIGSGRVLKYDIDGNYIDGFGRIGSRAGQFARPRGVAVDVTGDTYVVDGGHQNVQVFNSEGRILGFFGNPGLPAGSMNLPSGVAVSRDHLEQFQKLAAPGFKLESVIFVVNQVSSPINQAISVYGRGEMEGAQ